MSPSIIFLLLQPPSPDKNLDPILIFVLIFVFFFLKNLDPSFQSRDAGMESTHKDTATVSSEKIGPIPISDVRNLMVWKWTYCKSLPR